MFFSIIISSHQKITRKKECQEIFYSSNGFNSNYMYFVGYETREKLMWTSGKGFRNNNKISKQGIPKININMTYILATLGFGCFPHKYTCDILS